MVRLTGAILIGDGVNGGPGSHKTEEVERYDDHAEDGDDHDAEQHAQGAT